MEKKIDFSKPYCGVCGAQDRVRYLRSTPDGDRMHVCRDATACQRRFRAQLKADRKLKSFKRRAR